MNDYALPDGRVVRIRQIRPDDGERLRTTHDGLSPETQYRRFLVAKPELTPADARYLTQVDGHDHFALVATVPGGPSIDDPDARGHEAIVAVARFIRPVSGARVAEFAIVVADGHQGAGLGHELLSRLAQAAVERGVTRFRATTLTDNTAIRRLMQRIASGPVSWHADGSTIEAEFTLPAGPHGSARAAA